MSRNFTQSYRRNRNDSEEDDDYLNTSLSTSSLQSKSSPNVISKRNAPNRNDSSEDSDDQLEKRLQVRGGSHYSDRSQDRDTQPTTNNVRKIPSNRVIQRESYSSAAPSGVSSKGFVPRDINSKSQYGNNSRQQSFSSANNGNGSNSNSRNNSNNNSRNPSDSESNPNFGKVPRKFLDESTADDQQREGSDRDVRGSHSSWTSARSSRDAPLPQRQQSYSHSNNVAKDGVASKFNGNSRHPSSHHSSQQHSYRDDEPDEDAGDISDHSSQMSSNTVDDFDSPTPEKNGRHAAKKQNQHQLQQNSNQSNYPDRNRNRGSDQQDSDRGRDAARGPPRHVSTNSGGSFADFAEKSESMGVVLPRKSGRYQDEPSPRDAHTEYRYDRDGAKYVDRRSDSEGERGSNNGSRRSSGNWVASGPAAEAPGAAAQGNSKYQTQPARAPSPYVASNKHSFVLVAHPRGLRTEHVQCTVRRDRTSIQGKLYPTYEMILEDPRKTLIVACKMSLNRTSNYHLFDMTRGQAGSKLSKKNGNYLGKLRAKNGARTEYVLLNQSSEREELAGVLFDRLSLISQLKDGNQPRKMKVLVPALDENNVPIPNKTTAENDGGSLCEKLLIMDDWEATQETTTSSTAAGSRQSKAKANAVGMFAYQSKDPVFENGNYRLNFNGRVSMPSVKNYQLVATDDIDNIICQFGKVDEDAFHLDYKEPLNAVQAFAFALCQFNL